MTPAEEPVPVDGQPLTPYADLVAILKGLPLLAREFRRARGLSLRDAADQAGLPHSTLYRVENGQPANVSSTILLLRWFEQGGAAPAILATKEGA